MPTICPVLAPRLLSSAISPRCFSRTIPIDVRDVVEDDGDHRDAEREEQDVQQEGSTLELVEDRAERRVQPRRSGRRLTRVSRNCSPARTRAAFVLWIAVWSKTPYHENSCGDFGSFTGTTRLISLLGHEQRIREEVRVVDPVLVVGVGRLPDARRS